MDGSRRVIRSAVLDLNGLLLLEAEKTCVALIDYAATSRDLSEKLGSFARQPASARAVRRSLLQQGFSARLPLTLHRRLRWRRTSVLTSFFQMNTGSLYSIKVVASVFGGIVGNAHWHHRPTGPSPGVMVRAAIGHTSRSPLVCIDDTLNSAGNTSGLLRPVALPFIPALRNPTFQQDNARLPVVGPFLIRLLP
ncbi:hypothetical protein TNCV_1232521 [Trichonephila clavipes]|nr:hypothetical protein TNCV_1232521 [Trichonephila clavipes]